LSFQLRPPISQYTPFGGYFKQKFFSYFPIFYFRTKKALTQTKAERLLLPAREKLVIDYPWSFPILEAPTFAILLRVKLHRTRASEGRLLLPEAGMSIVYLNKNSIELEAGTAVVMT